MNSLLCLQHSKVIYKRQQKSKEIKFLFEQHVRFEKNFDCFFQALRFYVALIK